MKKSDKFLLLSLLATIGATKYLNDKKDKDVNKQIDSFSNNGIYVNKKILIGGTYQYIKIKGKDKNNPVLLYIHGGPGEAMSAFSHTFEEKWNDKYTMAIYDQRGCGLSDKLNEKLKLEDFINDLKEVGEYILSVLPGSKIIIFGHSWGSLLGAYGALLYPNIFSAYIGAGFVYNPKEAFEVGFNKALELARENNDLELLEKLEEAKDSPNNFASKAYMEAKSKYGFTSVKHSSLEKLLAKMLKDALHCPDLSYKDALKSASGELNFPKYYLDFIKSDAFLNIDLRDKGYEYKIPFFLLEGDHDYQTPYPLALEYFNNVKAPIKKWFTINNAGHSIMEDNIDEVTKALDEIKEILI